MDAKNTKVDLWEVVRRLDEIGVKAGHLSDAVRRGYIAAASCTTNHPPLMRGIVGWGEVVCALREHLIPFGWHPSDENNYSRVIDPNRRIAIAVATGDEATGNPKATPATKSLKGPQTAAAVTLNQIQFQLDLFQNSSPQRVEEPRLELFDGLITYILLVHRAPTEVRSELSLPDQITDEGRVNGWSERIILDPLPLDGEPIELASPEQPDLEIEIKRRAS